MTTDWRTEYHIHKSYRVLLSIMLVEFLMFVISGVSFTSLHGDTFFNFGVDPLYWFFYLSGLPQFILRHQWLCILADVAIIFSAVMLMMRPGKQKWALLLFFLLFIFYLTLTGYLGHRNYQSGFIWVMIPFLFRQPVQRAFAFSFIRYFLLFFYFSAGLIKILNGAFISTAHFSSHLTQQFTPYFLEGNIGFRTSLNVYLIHHPL
ncbi:MAG: hypothetical protein FGM46_03015, partial [Ferruginibacter sp.]|nr:hypothetical protein [Ferruginibacter sp.]